MKILKLGLKSKEFSCRNRALSVSFPVILLTSAALKVIFFSGSEMFTKRTPARRAISSEGPEALVLPNFVDNISGFDVFP